MSTTKQVRSRAATRRNGRVAPPGADARRAMFEQMLLVRAFEEQAEEQYTRARVGGYLHLSIGEEATVVGALAATEPSDYVLASYRDHAVALARCGDPTAVMAELFGKDTGLAHGRGGSMHLLCPNLRFLGGWGIVGGHLPIAVGVALALDYQEQPDAVLCFLGDGAVNIGTFHEALNLAAVFHLPVVFVIVNNQYGMGTSVQQASAEPELYRRAAAYRMVGERVDGMDVLAVWAATRRLLARARDKREPALLECETYRFRGHSVADPGKAYRTAEEIAAWRERDPLVLFERALRDEGLLDDAAVEAARDRVARQVEEAVRAAAAAPDPPLESLYAHVYGDAAREQFARMAPGAPFEERYTLGPRGGAV